MSFVSSNSNPIYMRLLFAVRLAASSGLKLFRPFNYGDGRDCRLTAQNWSIVDVPKQSYRWQIEIQLPNTTDVKPKMLPRCAEMDSKKGGHKVSPASGADSGT